MYIPLTLKQLTNYDFNRTGEVTTFIANVASSIKFTNNLVSEMVSHGKISLIEWQDAT